MLSFLVIIRFYFQKFNLIPFIVSKVSSNHQFCFLFTCTCLAHLFADFNLYFLALLCGLPLDLFFYLLFVLILYHITLYVYKCVFFKFCKDFVHFFLSRKSTGTTVCHSGRTISDSSFFPLSPGIILIVQLQFFVFLFLVSLSSFTTLICIFIIS